jgi:hypothetical protein
MFTFSSLAFAVQTHLGAGASVSRTRIHETLAALLGFGTYSAYQVAELKSPGAAALKDAEYIVLQPEYATSRCLSLGLNQEQIAALIPAAVAALLAVNAARQHKAPRIYGDYEHFRAATLDEIAQKAVDDSQELVDAFSITNATPAETIAEYFTPASQILPALEYWEVEAEGTVSGDQNPEKLYYGHKGRFTALLRFEKVSRVGLRYQDADVSVSIADDPSVSLSDVYGET